MLLGESLSYLMAARPEALSYMFVHNDNLRRRIMVHNNSFKKIVRQASNMRLCLRVRPEWRPSCIHK